MGKVQIIRLVARLNIGGPAVHILNLMSVLDSHRFESRLIVGLPEQREGNMTYLAKQKGIEPRVIPELGREIAPFSDILVMYRLIRIFRRQRPHIVETHTAKAGAIGRFAAYLAGVPVIIHVFHGHVFHSYFSPLKTRLFITIERMLAHITDRVITISPAQYHDITKVYGIAPSKKTEMIPLGLDLRSFSVGKQDNSGEFRSAFDIPEDSSLVGFVGRLTPVKNPRLFIEAARLVLQKSPGVRFVIVGDGELRPELEQSVERLGLSRQVIFTGWQEDMTAIYTDLNVLTLTSLNEGTPVTIIEALASGVPVVATAVGGVPDILTDQQTGLLVPSNDAQSVAQGILTLLQNPAYAQELTKVGQHKVLERFDLSRLASDMESLYLNLLREKGVI